MDFKCNRYCGKCCINLAVKVNAKDIKKIKKLGFEHADFLENDLINPKEFILKKKENGHCVFLKKKENMFYCSIYEFRPKICKKYPFFDKKPIESCFPEYLFPEQMFSFKAGRK